MREHIDSGVFRRYAQHLPGCKLGPHENSCSCGYFSAMHDCDHEPEPRPPSQQIVDVFRGKKGELRGYVEDRDNRHYDPDAPKRWQEVARRLLKQYARHLEGCPALSAGRTARLLSAGGCSCGLASYL